MERWNASLHKIAIIDIACDRSHSIQQMHAVVFITELFFSWPACPICLLIHMALWFLSDFDFIFCFFHSFCGLLSIVSYIDCKWIIKNRPYTVNADKMYKWFRDTMDNGIYIVAMPFYCYSNAATGKKLWNFL